MSQRAQILAAYHQLISRGWAPEQAQRELESAVASQGDYMMHDKDGNVIIDGRSLSRTDQGIDIPTDSEMEQLRREANAKIHAERERQRIDDERKRREDDHRELEMRDGQLQEKQPHDSSKAPMWTEVRGHASFYYICPRCGAMIPGTGPKLVGPDGKERSPKEQHENWHATVLVDWDEESEDE